MIGIWNRKIVFSTFSMKEQARVRNLLAEHQIDYRITTLNRNSPSPFGSMRAQTGTLKENMEMTCEYFIYVAKKDYEAACGLIQRAGR